MLSDEEKKAIQYFKEKIKNKLPLYEETYIDGKPYRRNILQLETNFTEEQANKTEIVLNLIEKQTKEIEELKEKNFYLPAWVSKKYISKDKIKAKIEELKEDIKYSANPLSIDNSKFGIKVLQSLLEKE